MERKLNTESFIAKAIQKHGNLYNYDKTIYTYSNANVIITCPIHGDFFQYANNHLKGRDCPKCGYAKQSNNRTKDVEKFITEARIKHGNKYDYCKVLYKHTEIKVIIICPVHGEFTQRPSGHLRGRGCNICNSIGGGYTLTNFINICNNNPNSDPKVYVIRCFNDNEEFIKIGLTSGTVIKRFQCSPIPYKYEILEEIKGSPKFVYDLEHSIHNKYKEFKYKPLLRFGGETECYNTSIYPF